MMSLTPIFIFLDNPPLDQIRQITALYNAEGWFSGKKAGDDLAARIIAGSHCFVVAAIDGEIIGMGRCISDGISDAYVQDVTVKNAYRKLGIGSGIINALLVRLKADGLKWIGLVAERGSCKFYEQLGFKKMADSIPMLKILL